MQSLCLTNIASEVSNAPVRGATHYDELPTLKKPPSGKLIFIKEVRFFTCSLYNFSAESIKRVFQAYWRSNSRASNGIPCPLKNRIATKKCQNK